MEIKEQREILRTLAKEVAEISVLPIQKKTEEQWKKLNSLNPDRPMFMLDQLPWGQLNYNGELICICEDSLMRQFEWQLRETLYRWRHMPDDRVISGDFWVGRAVSSTGFGLNIQEDLIHGEPGTAAHSHDYKDVLPDEESIEKIQFPTITENAEHSANIYNIAEEIFDGILKIRQHGMNAHGHVWDQISTWHGVEECIYDLAARPEFIHKILDRTFKAYHHVMDQYEKLGLIDVGQPLIHCTGAYNDELPGFRGETEEELKKYKYSAKNAWTMGAAQLFSMVSPEMHNEFEIEYHIKWYERFGLGYYGCCEPLDRKIHVIRRLPNVRKISMSPWVDMELGSEAMNGDYVFSRKPNPMFLASDISWDVGLVRKDLSDACNIAAKYGNPCELILKDVSTVGNNPQRLWEWAKIAAEVCGRR